MAAFGQQPAANPNPGDIEVANAATDGISCVTWSPTANFLAVASWDHQIRVWDVQTSSGQAVPKAATSHDGPVLCAAWSSDGARVFTGSCDKTAKVWDLASSSHTQVAAHDAPIKNIFWVSEINMIVTSSWDKTIKYWDGRSGAAVATLQLPERPFCMDIRYPLSAPCDTRPRAGPTPATHELPASSTARPSPRRPSPPTAAGCRALRSGDRDGGPQDRRGQPEQPEPDLQPDRLAPQVPEPMHRRLPRPTGLLPRIYRGALTPPHAPGPPLTPPPPSLPPPERCTRQAAPPPPHATHTTLQGRVAVHHVNERDAAKNFAFKCHREGNDIYAVDDLKFHPTFGTFATTGSDGTFNFWDKDSRQRLKAFNKESAPIPCGGFNREGNIYAYAVSYDWSKGSEHYNPRTNRLLLHPVPEAEIKSRNNTKKNFGARR